MDGRKRYRTKSALCLGNLMSDTSASAAIGSAGHLDPGNLRTALMSNYKNVDILGAVKGSQI